MLENWEKYTKKRILSIGILHLRHNSNERKNNNLLQFKRNVMT
jgi:hypothetical protein